MFIHDYGANLATGATRCVAPIHTRCVAPIQMTACRYALRLQLVLASVVLISACAPFGLKDTTLPETPSPLEIAAAAEPVDQTIADDLIKVAKQIFPPVTTTLQFPATSDDALLEYFTVKFADAGYGIQRVSADQGSNFFSYSRNETRMENGDPLIEFRSSIGAVEIARDYTVPDTNSLSPAGPVQLSGTRVPVEVVDLPSGRFVIDEPDFSTVTYVASLNLDAQQPPVISLITDDVVTGVANQSTGTETASLQAVNSSQMEINNLFFGGQSNFNSILNSYDQVDRRIIVFGDDSLVLGDTNKLLIERFVQQQMTDGDVISLVGCSNGPTALEIGNEGLALGRAERVTEALQSLGVAREKILDEGCWAPVSAGEKFPSRGVVMELWRKQS